MSGMAPIVTCEPNLLFNLLNQVTYRSKLSEVTFLSLIDLRDADEFYRSHIVSAKNHKPNSDGSFSLPSFVDVEGLEYLIIYDGNTSSVEEPGRATTCAKVLAKVSVGPVQILRGGFQRFTAVYHFLSTEKILFSVTELDNLMVYPVEILPGMLYMGDLKQRMNRGILKDLKINACVNIVGTKAMEQLRKWGMDNLNIVMNNCVEADMYSHFPNICDFIVSHLIVKNRVLILSEDGKSRACTATIAFLMHRFKSTFEEAYKSVLKCKITVNPNTAFLEQLSNWEADNMGRKWTDMSRVHLPVIKSLLQE